MGLSHAKTGSGGASGAPDSDARAGTAGVNPEVGLCMRKRAAGGFGRARLRRSGGHRWGQLRSGTFACENGRGALRARRNPLLGRSGTSGLAWDFGPHAGARSLRDVGPFADNTALDLGPSPTLRGGRRSPLAPTHGSGPPTISPTHGSRAFPRKRTPTRARQRLSELPRLALPRKRRPGPRQHLSEPRPIPVSAENAGPDRSKPCPLGRTPRIPHGMTDPPSSGPSISRQRIA